MPQGARPINPRNNWLPLLAKRCVQACPAKDKGNPKHKSIDMLPHAEHVEREPQQDVL